MGHLPASERPRSCSLGTGPFVFPALLLATPFASPSFTRHINGLREYRAPAAIAAAKIVSAPRSKSRQRAAQERQQCRSRSIAQRVRFFARMVDRLFLLPRGQTRKPQQAWRAEGPNFAGTGRFFSSKIMTAAEKTPPIREETQMKSRTLTVLALAAGLFAAGQAFAQQQPAPAAPAAPTAPPDLNAIPEKMPFNIPLRHADHRWSGRKGWLRRRSTRPPSAAGR